MQGGGGLGRGGGLHKEMRCREGARGLCKGRRWCRRMRARVCIEKKDA